MEDQVRDERIRRQIKDAARGLFTKWGLQKTTIEDIAKAAHKGKSTLYYYFKSKDEIFAEIVREELDMILRKAKLAIESEASARDKIRAFFFCQLSEFRQRAVNYDAVFGRETDFASVISTVRRQGYERVENLVRELVSDGIRSGEFAPRTDQEVVSLATILLLTFRMIVIEYAFGNAPDEAKPLLDLALTVFMDGLKS